MTEGGAKLPKQHLIKGRRETNLYPEAKTGSGERGKGPLLLIQNLYGNVLVYILCYKSHPYFLKIYRKLSLILKAFYKCLILFYSTLFLLSPSQIHTTHYTGMVKISRSQLQRC